MSYIKPPFIYSNAKSNSVPNPAQGSIDYYDINLANVFFEHLDNGICLELLNSALEDNENYPLSCHGGQERDRSFSKVYDNMNDDAGDDAGIDTGIDTSNDDCGNVSDNESSSKDNSSHSNVNSSDFNSHDNDQNDDEDKDDNDKKEDTNLTHNLEDKDLGDDVDPVERDSIKALTEDESFSQPKSYGSILAEEFVHARGTFKRSNGSVFTSAFMAGLEIGISYIVLLAVYALLLNFIPAHIAIVLASLMYPIGFITVVIGQSLLYTEQTSLLSLPVIAGIESFKQLIQIWSLVIVGNVVGGCLFCLSVVWLGLQMSWFDTSHINDFTNHVLDYPWRIILASAIVAGWLMGLAAWLATSARDTFSRIVLVAIITACIGVLGLHHSIVGNIEIFAGLIYGTDTSLADYLIFLVLALLGNTIGGAVFVSVLKAGSLKYDIDKLKEERLQELRKDWKRFH